MAIIGRFGLQPSRYESPLTVLYFSRTVSYFSIQTATDNWPVAQRESTTSTRWGQWVRHPPGQREAGSGGRPHPHVGGPRHTTRPARRCASSHRGRGSPRSTPGPGRSGRPRRATPSASASARRRPCRSPLRPPLPCRRCPSHRCPGVARTCRAVIAGTLERTAGLEPASPPRQGGALPLCYIRSARPLWSCGAVSVEGPVHRRRRRALVSYYPCP